MSNDNTPPELPTEAAPLTPEQQAAALTPSQRKQIAAETFREICTIASRAQAISQDLRLNPELFPGQQDLGRDLGRVSLLLHGIVNGIPWEYTTLEKPEPKPKEEKATDEERKARLGDVAKD